MPSVGRTFCSAQTFAAASKLFASSPELEVSTELQATKQNGPDNGKRLPDINNHSILVIKPDNDKVGRINPFRKLPLSPSILLI